GRLPNEPLEFIRRCVAERKILWTYHVNMRMKDRFISREMLIESAQSYEIIEEYSQDKYYPSYLVLGRHEKSVFHALFGVDVYNYERAGYYRVSP
ncbi:MAG: DUF4258 domain-containing protein, partial [Nitrospinota bacterium]